MSKRLETELLSAWQNKTDVTFDNCLHFDFAYFVPQHLILTLEYNILSAYLRNTLARIQHKQEEINATLITQILVARKIAIFLSYLYEKKLNVPREAVRLRNDELFFRTILSQPGSLIQNQLQNPWASTPPLVTSNTQHNALKSIDTQTIRTKHVIGNWIRVFTTRSRRLFNNVRPFINDHHTYHGLMESFEKVADPCFAHFAWAFYVPRLIINLGLLVKHIVPHPWMSKEEEQLAFTVRLRAQWQRRWFELANDSVWLVSGLLCCFLLLGPLLPAAAYLIAALYAYDIVLAVARAVIELRRLYKLRREYKDAQVPMELQQELHAHIAYERRRLYINVGYMTALTVAIAFTIPILVASGPLFPLIGAALLVAVTLISFILLQLNEKTRPVTQKPTSSPYRFFKIVEPCAPISDSTAVVDSQLDIKQDILPSKLF